MLQAAEFGCPSLMICDVWAYGLYTEEIWNMEEVKR
jgi:hypothetical protein